MFRFSRSRLNFEPPVSLSRSCSRILIRGPKGAPIIIYNESRPPDVYLSTQKKNVQQDLLYVVLYRSLASHLFDKEKDKPVKRGTRENRQRESKGGKRNAGNAYTCSPRASTHMRERDSTHVLRARTSPHPPALPFAPAVQAPLSARGSSKHACALVHARM